jgi:hypothetical protein
MTLNVHHGVVLAIYPNSRGIAFVVFEGEHALIDWGIRGARYKHNRERHLAGVRSLLALYRPVVVILQNMGEASTRRSERIRSLNKQIVELAARVGTSVCSYSRAQVRVTFGELKEATKEKIASAIATEIPALTRHIPPPRKPWNSEHASMGVFDAAALALTFFRREAGSSNAGASPPTDQDDSEGNG